MLIDCHRFVIITIIIRDRAWVHFRRASTNGESFKRVLTLKLILSK